MTHRGRKPTKERGRKQPSEADILKLARDKQMNVGEKGNTVILTGKNMRLGVLGNALAEASRRILIEAGCHPETIDNLRCLPQLRCGKTTEIRDALDASETRMVPVETWLKHGGINRDEPFKRAMVCSVIRCGDEAGFKNLTVGTLYRSVGAEGAEQRAFSAETLRDAGVTHVIYVGNAHASAGTPEVIRKKKNQATHQSPVASLFRTSTDLRKSNAHASRQVSNQDQEAALAVVRSWGS